MKTLVHKMLIIIAFFLCIEKVYTQNGWSVGNYYYNQGGSDRSCGPIRSVWKTDGWSSWYEGWQTCRDRNWYQEYYSGYIYFWGNNGWYTEWREGYFWTFNWYDFEYRAW